VNKIANPDNKEQLMAAFDRIIAEKKREEFKIATKQEEVEKEKNKQVLEVASTYTVDSIVKGLADLQLDFGTIVNGLAEKLAKENSKLDELKQAIEVETEHFQELQKTRIVADTLHILTQEHQEKLKGLQQNATSQKEVLEKETSQYRKEWQQEQSEFETRTQKEEELLIKERQQAEEEYQYRLELTRKINVDAYQSQKRKQELELQETNETKQKNWAEREKVLTDNQAEFEANRKKVEAFTVELDEAVKKAREEAIKDVHKDAKVKADLFEKEWQATKQSHELKIQSLEEAIAKQVEQIQSLSTQLEAALKQAQSLAMRAFESSTGKFAQKAES
jgi:hypothetical protein